MAEAKRICLNMIVKNEIKSLGRCLSSVAPFISCWVIGDTGSTDGTQDFIETFFAERGIPGELHRFPFVNFEQSRNLALDFAYASPLEFDYLLFNDADMEVVVDDPDFRAKLELPGYMFQIRCGITYWLTRLVHRHSGTRYRGVTHEYMDVKGQVGKLEGVWILDHATGSNRAEKFERDIRLLTEGLKAEPHNDRYQFYLAESYLNAGRLAEAVDAYAKRIAMGGWDEEVWYSRLKRARTFWRMEDEANFVREALAAFDARPHRAEPLYDLARFHRQRGMNDASALFAEEGLKLKWPDQDVLFIEDFVYRFGLAEEYSIAANYARDPVRKARGFAACDWLALNRQAPEASRSLARQNLRFYAGPACETTPSFSSRRLEGAPQRHERGAHAAIARLGERILVLWTSLCVEANPARSFLLHLTDALDVVGVTEILEASDPTEADARVFAWRGALWRLSRARSPSRSVTLARVAEGDGCFFAKQSVLAAERPVGAEEGWTPIVEGDSLRFIQGCDPLTVADANGLETYSAVPPVAADSFFVASQTTPLAGGWLGLVREGAGEEPDLAHYHRFVWFGAAHEIERVSRPFYLERRGRERVTGLCAHPDGERLVLSFSADDGEFRLATILAQEALDALHSVAVYAAPTF